MCESRTWNKLWTAELTIAENVIILPLFAERSDYETFNILLTIKESDLQSEIAFKMKKAFEALESYRNCDCTIAGGECIRHKSQIAVDIPRLGSNNSSMNSGRK